MLKIIIAIFVIFVIYGWLSAPRSDSAKKQEKRCRNLEKVIMGKYPAYTDIEVYFCGYNEFASLTNHGIYYLLQNNSAWTTGFIAYESIVSYHVKRRQNNQFYNDLFLTLGEPNGYTHDFKISVAVHDQKQTFAMLDQILEQYKK